MKALSGLYAITDESLIAQDVFCQSVEAVLIGGAKIIQYRDKSNHHKKRLQQCQQIKKLCVQYDSLFIVNDDVELAKYVDADGVHIGAEDMAISDARKTLGNNKIIGVSCYNQIELAKKAQQSGANYLAFGRFFSSTTKPDTAQAEMELLCQAKNLNLPLCAIGGINQNNARPLIEAGADMLAVIGGLFGSKNIQQSSYQLSRLLSQFAS